MNQTCEPKAIYSLHKEVTSQSNEKSMLYNDRDKLHTLICTHTKSPLHKMYFVIFVKDKWKRGARWQSIMETSIFHWKIFKKKNESERVLKKMKAVFLRKNCARNREYIPILNFYFFRMRSSPFLFWVINKRSHNLSELFTPILIKRMTKITFLFYGSAYLHI